MNDQETLPPPMDMGDILDGAFALYRRHFFTIVAALGVVVVPVRLLEVGVSPFFGIVGLVLGPLTSAIATLIVIDAFERRQPTFSTVWQRAGRRLAPLIVATVLYFLIVAVGFVLVVIPGILFAVWFAFYGQVVVAERGRPIKSFGRSRRLVRGHWWRVFGILIVAWLLVAFVAGLVESGILAGVEAANPSDQARDVASAATGAVVSLLISPIGALMAALLYLDQRGRSSRREAERAARGPLIPEPEPRT
jgi:hypothetical protein